MINVDDSIVHFRDLGTIKFTKSHWNWKQTSGKGMVHVKTYVAAKIVETK